MELAFDTLASAKEALASAEQHQQTPLTIVAFVDKWSPFAMRTAQEVETLRSSQDVRFARLFLLDMAQVRARAHWLAACPVVAAAGQRRAPNPARRGNNALPRASQEEDAAWEAGVTSTPALRFYWKGSPVSVHRSDWEPASSFVGQVSRAHLLELIRHTKDCCIECAEKDRPLAVGIDF